MSCHFPRSEFHPSYLTEPLRPRGVITQDLPGVQSRLQWMPGVSVVLFGILCAVSGFYMGKWKPDYRVDQLTAAPIVDPSYRLEEIGRILAFLINRSKQHEELLVGRWNSSVLPEASAGEAGVELVSVRVSKANLRTGPGFEHAPFAAVAGGSRLLVEAREGDWFRVIAPTGERAWISRSVVE